MSRNGRVGSNPTGGTLNPQMAQLVSAGILYIQGCWFKSNSEDYKIVFVTQIKNIKIYCYKDSYCVNYVILDDDYISEVSIPKVDVFATEDECRKSIPIKKNK